MTKYNWTRVNNDVYGNPRYVIHFLDCAPKTMAQPNSLVSIYDDVVKLMNKIGGRRFHNKQYGGGIVFQSYNLGETEKAIEEAKNRYDKKNVSNNS